MAERVTPGRALSPEEYSGGFVDFYKDYLGSSGIKSTVPVDDDDDDKKEKDYIAPNITGDGEDDNTPTSVLTMNALGKSSQLGSNIEHMSAADIQSMDLTSKTWNDWRSAKGQTDKVNLKAESGYQGLAAMVGGTAGSMIYGALGGTGEKTPWGIENSGAGAFRVVSNTVNSMKFDALKEMQALRNAHESFEGGADAMMDFGDPTQFKPDIDNGDYNIGYVMRVNGQNLIRPAGKTQYLGTLPMGVTNQQILNQEALESKKLPNYQGGFGTEDGFGITNEGGYNSAGRYVDEYGTISQVGLQKHFEALADKDFFGNQDRDWLDAVREAQSKSGFFGTGMSSTEAQALKDKLNADNPNRPTTTPFKSGYDYTNEGSFEITDPRDQPFGRGRYTPGGYPVDQIYDSDDAIFDPITLEEDRYTDMGNTSLQNLTREANLDDEYNTYSRANITQNMQAPNFNPRIGTQYLPSYPPAAGTGFKGITSPDRGLRSRMRSTQFQSPQDIFDDMINRKFTPKEAADVLNTIVPQTGLTKSLEQQRKDFISGSVVPASYTTPSDDSTDDTTFEDQVKAETEMGLDPFGGAGEPVDTSGESSGSSDDKIVCTAMNNAYGFGSFRQTIWLKHSKDLDPAYQLGYHKLFRPLVKYAYVNDNLPNKIIKKWLEGVAKRRTADIWLQSRNKKRPIFGRIERAILEPICYIAGKI